ncbi:MAG: calcium-binding protein [Gammaproteobacteria bacterium]
MDRPTHFFRLNLLYLVSILGLFFFSTSVFSDPVYGVESCSKIIGTSSKDCYQDDTANGWDDTSNGSLDGWVSSNVQEWHGNETVPYRFDISLPAANDASTYFVRVEQDNLQSGVTGVDGASAFYVGAGANASITEGQMTKHCTAVPGGSSLPALPYQGDECVVAGPTFTGMDDDGDGRIDEEVVNGIDDDGDGLIDEDPMPDCASSTGAQHIQYTAAIHFDPDEAGASTSNWALYWLSHFSPASNGFPGGSLDTWVRSHREGDADPTNCPATPEVPVSPQPVVYCEGATATIVGTTGTDHIIGTSGNDIIFGVAGGDYIHGGAGDDTLCGSDQVDHFYGEDGNDVLETYGGADYAWGGAGNDQIFGGDQGDHLYGDDGIDLVDGGTGADYVFGGAGDDHVLGGAGSDHVYGDDGNDTVEGGADNDVVDGGAGVDQVYGDDGKDHIYGGDGDDVLHGGAGDDILNGQNGNDQVFGDDGNDSVSDSDADGDTSNDGDDTIHGGTGDDTLNGGYGNDILYGDVGDDKLYGLYGDDAMDGGDGTADTCAGGSGTDTATNCETVYQVP